MGPSTLTRATLIRMPWATTPILRHMLRHTPICLCLCLRKASKAIRSCPQDMLRRPAILIFLHRAILPRLGILMRALLDTLRRSPQLLLNPNPRPKRRPRLKVLRKPLLPLPLVSKRWTTCLPT